VTGAGRGGGQGRGEPHNKEGRKKEKSRVWKEGTQHGLGSKERVKMLKKSKSNTLKKCGGEKGGGGGVVGNEQITKNCGQETPKVSHGMG